MLVRYRVDGILEEAFRFPKWVQNPLVARLKVMAKLDITERRMPQDGRIQVRYEDKTRRHARVELTRAARREDHAAHPRREPGA